MLLGNSRSWHSLWFFVLPLVLSSPISAEDGRALQSAADERRFQEVDRLLQLGHVAQQAGEIEGAIEHYSKAIEILPKHPRLHYLLAICWEQAGEPENMLKSLRAALDAAGALSLDEVAHARQLLHTQLLPTLDETQRQLFDEAKRRIEYADILDRTSELRRQHFAKACSLLVELLNQNPTYLPAIRLRSMVNENLGYLDDARADAIRFLDGYLKLEHADPRIVEEVKRQLIVLEPVEPSSDVEDGERHDMRNGLHEDLIDPYCEIKMTIARLTSVTKHVPNFMIANIGIDYRPQVVKSFKVTVSVAEIGRNEFSGNVTFPNTKLNEEIFHGNVHSGEEPRKLSIIVSAEAVIPPGLEVVFSELKGKKQIASFDILLRRTPHDQTLVMQVTNLRGGKLESQKTGKGNEKGMRKQSIVVDGKYRIELHATP